MERWRIVQEDSKKRITLEEYDELKEGLRSVDRVTKLLGLYSSKRLYQDWMSAEPSEKKRKDATWPQFLEKMRTMYKPTENSTLKNYQFRQLLQSENETLTAFMNRVEAEAKHCQFNCESDDCTAEMTAVRDQVLIGTVNNTVREEALLKSWDLKTLRREGVQIESAQKSGAEIAGEAVNKIHKYSNRYQDKKTPVKKSNKKIQCYFCGESVTNIKQHKETKCKGIQNKCSTCQKMGHLPKVCRAAAVNAIDDQEEEGPGKDAEENNLAYNVGIFQINATKQVVPKFRSNRKEYKAKVMINNNLVKVTADTGAKVSVCGTKQAKEWGLLSRMLTSKTTLKPYQSKPIAVYGEATCSVVFGLSSIPLIWHIISGSCEPILSGAACEELGIIEFRESPEPFEPIHMISVGSPDQKTWF